MAGAILFLFGLSLFFMPTVTIENTVLILGIVLVIGGIFHFMEALFCMKGADLSAYVATSGIASFVVGLLLVIAPSLVTTGVIFAFGGIALLLAIIALVAGVAQVVYSAKSKIKRKALPYAMGIILVLMGLLVLLNPFGAAIALVMLVGLFTIIYGMALIVLAFHVRELLECR